MPDNKEHRVDKETNVWRKIEKILGAPSHRIAWKFEEAGKIEALIDFKQRWTRGYKRYKETSGLIEWKECQIFHSIFT